MLWLDVFRLQVLTEVGQVVLEYLLEQLQDLPHLAIVEAVERHNWIFGDHVAKSYKCGLLLHVEEKDRCHVGHPLNVTDVRTEHSKGLKDSLQLFIVEVAWLEYFKGRKSAWQVRFNNTDASFPTLYTGLDWRSFIPDHEV